MNKEDKGTEKDTVGSVTGVEKREGELYHHRCYGGTDDLLLNEWSDKEIIDCGNRCGNKEGLCGDGKSQGTKDATDKDKGYNTCLDTAVVVDEEELSNVCEKWFLDSFGYSKQLNLLATAIADSIRQGEVVREDTDE